MQPHDFLRERSVDFSICQNQMLKRAIIVWVPMSIGIERGGRQNERWISDRSRGHGANHKSQNYGKKGRYAVTRFNITSGLNQQI